MLSEFTQAPDGRVTFSPPGPLSAASWVNVQPVSFDLTPGHTVPVKVTVSVPASHEPGERYVGVIFRVPAEQAEGNVAVSGAIGIQLLMNVPGEVIRSIGVGPLTAPRFSDGGPVQLRLNLHNLGNVHRDYVKPDTLTATIVGKTNVSFGDFTILGDSSRVVEAAWLDPPLFCLCMARVTADDGRGHPVTVEARFIVFPFRLVAGVLIAAMGLFLLTRRGPRRQRRHARPFLEEVRRAAHQQARQELLAAAVSPPGRVPSGSDADV